MSEAIVEQYADPTKGFTGVRVFAKTIGQSEAEVRKALQASDVYTLNRRAVRTFPRRKTFANSVNEQFQADLADLNGEKGANDNSRYILVVIDVFTRYLWCEPCKSKDAKDVTEAFEKVFAEAVPKKLQTDQGKEFFNTKMAALCEKLGINHFHVNSEIKCAIAERVIRTLRMRLTRLWDAIGSFRYLDHLQQIVELYNNTYHKSLKMTPIEARLPENKGKVFMNLYGDLVPEPKSAPLEIDQHVRIATYRGIFTKEQVNPWSHEIYKVARVVITNPVTYKLKDSKGEIIDGSFYRQELQPVAEPKDYGVEILDRRTHRRKKQVLVRWIGYADLEPEWIDESQLA
jgi:transposase InsO family protein